MEREASFHVGAGAESRSIGEEKALNGEEIGKE